jgi:hypothetical protein
MVTCQKNLGSVGIENYFFLLSAKLEIVVPGSGKPSFVEAIL